MNSVISWGLRASLIILAALTASCRERQNNSIGAGWVEVPINEGYGLRYPTWLPDEQHIAVSEQTHIDQIAPSKLLLIDSASGASTTLFESFAGVYYPNWTQDGSRMVLVEGCKILEFVLPSDRGNPLGDGCGVALSPDDQRIVFLNVSSTDSPHFELLVRGREASDSEPSSLFLDASATLGGRLNGIDWKGEAIAFSYRPSMDINTSYDVIVLDEQGTVVHRVDTAGDEVFPVLSSDGTWLLYVTDRPSSVGREQSIVLTPVGDETCQVERVLPAIVTGMDWSGDGERLALAINRAILIGHIRDLFEVPFSDLAGLCPPS